jgi:hypothetical protein
MADKSKEEEFYYLLTEGSEHLQAGRIEEARQHFERALVHNPQSEQGLNLLGLSLFRLGQLDRAKQLFAELVHQNPIEPSLRLNLAMVFLKQGRLDDAHVELERVLELNPDHPRAASYMGLVLEKKGHLERAADFYERAGNKKRADEIRAFRPTQTGTFPIPNLAAMGVQQTPTSIAPGPAAMRAAATIPPATIPPATIPPATVPPATTPSPPATTTSMSARSTTGLMPAVSLTPGGSVMPSPTTAPPKPVTPPAPGAPPSSSSARSTEAAALTAATSALLRKGPEPAPGRVGAAHAASMGFDLKPQPSPTAVTEVALADLGQRAVDGAALSKTAEGQLIVPIHDVGYVRTDLLGSLTGAFEIEAVNRRYRGKRTDSLFGGAEAAMVAVMGRGHAVLQLGDLVPTSLTLTSDDVYLVEGGVLSFSAGLVWENGRLPSETDRDLDIVHLRGSGRVVVGAARPLMALTVTPEAPVLVHAQRLLGWTGQLVPYRAPLPGLPEPARRVPVVRFEGTGTVLSL